MRDADEKLDCHAAMRRLWEYLDGELSDESMNAVRAHLSICAACYGHYDFERAFLAAVRDAERARLTPPALRARVLDALDREGFAPKYGEC